MAKFVYDFQQRASAPPQNIGIFDRVLRVVLGSAIIGVWFILPYPIDAVNVWFTLLPFLGVYPVVTGIIGWCPTYAIFHTKSCGTNKRNNCGTFPDQLEHLINPH